MFAEDGKASVKCMGWKCDADADASFPIAKVRRLYDVTTILTVLKLVEKVRLTGLSLHTDIIII